MNRTVLTLLAVLALATCLAVAQDQPAQNQPGQAQPMPQTEEQPAQPQQQHAKGERQTAMSSQQLQAAFQRTFDRYPELSKVKVNVTDDKIELSGTVADQADKDKLRRTAEANANGRKVVDDKLKVSGGNGQEKPPMSETPPVSEKPPMLGK